MNEGVCVVLDASDSDRVQLWFFAMPTHVRPQFRFEVFKDRLEAVFVLKYDVHVVADYELGLCRPFGTRS
jgi:hypothetical protein